jgi:hypothetical protein
MSKYIDKSTYRKCFYPQTDDIRVTAERLCSEGGLRRKQDGQRRPENDKLSSQKGRPGQPL